MVMNIMIDDTSCKIELPWKITLKFVNCFAKVAKVASGDSLALASAAASVTSSPSNTLLVLSLQPSF